MKTLATAVLATFMVILISGCSNHDMATSMNSEMSSMDKPAGKTREAGAMMEDTAAEPMKPKMERMDKTMNDETMMEDAAKDPMKPEMERMDKTMNNETMTEDAANDPMKPEMESMGTAAQ
jgi:hypothetical protein